MWDSAADCNQNLVRSRSNETQDQRRLPGASVNRSGAVLIMGKRGRAADSRSLHRLVSWLVEQYKMRQGEPERQPRSRLGWREACPSDAATPAS